MDWRTILAIAALVFALGRWYADSARQRKDLNGLGKVSRAFQLRVILALIVLAEKREDREWLAELFRGE